MSISRSLLVVAALVVTQASRAHAEGPPVPCTNAPRCLGHLALPDVTPRLAYFSSFPLDEDNPDVNTALIIVHGTGGDADAYFAHGTAATLAAGLGRSTLVVAPHFEALGAKGKKCPHGVAHPDDGDLYWSCEGWKEGAQATNGEVTSFAALDVLIGALAKRFSHLRTIVVAGHSAGAQILLRYAAVTRVAPGGGVSLRFVVANPGSYLYLDDARPTDAARCTVTGCPGGFATITADQRQRCPGLDDWKYGLERLDASAGGLGADDLRKSYLARPIEYLLGELDSSATDPKAHYEELDRSCSGEAQGPFRLHRGLAFMAYLAERWHQQPIFHIVPGCGHSAGCMFASEIGRATLFH